MRRITEKRLEINLIGLLRPTVAIIIGHTHARVPFQSDCSASTLGVGICTGTCPTGSPDTRWPAMSHSKDSVTGILLMRSKK